uniref:WAT1-related protein n=1 Tax=Oryza rufipogon TaxID=4529 RepID=A0A0E0QX76_ORYRU
MGSPSSVKMEWGSAACMVLIELFTTGQMLLTKVVVDAGLFVFALLTYRFFLGTIHVLPLAFILESCPGRSSTCCRLSEVAGPLK